MHRNLFEDVCVSTTRVDFYFFVFVPTVYRLARASFDAWPEQTSAFLESYSTLMTGLRNFDAALVHMGALRNDRFEKSHECLCKVSKDLTERVKNATTQRIAAMSTKVDAAINALGEMRLMPPLSDFLNACMEDDITLDTLKVDPSFFDQTSIANRYACGSFEVEDLWKELDLFCKGVSAELPVKPAAIDTDIPKFQACLAVADVLNQPVDSSKKETKSGQVKSLWEGTLSAVQRPCVPSGLKTLLRTFWSALPS